MSTTDILLLAVVVVYAVTMYIRVELDFKKNIFRILGHTIATTLIVLTILYFTSVIGLTLFLSWFLFSSVFLMVNEVIRIYLRKHSMKDILENHPRLYWLTRGKLARTADKGEDGNRERGAH